MNIYNFNDNSFKETDIYKTYIKDNTSYGCLNIRTYAANEAIPIGNVKIIVSKEIDNSKIIFYEGYTDTSGMINNIKLPTIPVNKDDLVVPIGTTYNIEVIYDKDNLKRTYNVLIYSDLCIIQNINIVPTINMEARYGF